ncbi:MAG: hypothetical protein ABIP20_01645 [Chthoniobacteraceae bacterium]
MLLLAVLAGLTGCDRTTTPGSAVVSESGHFAGRITSADGSPITLPGVEYKITISGVTAVGEHNAFHPPVGRDGTFKLKLPQGLFHPPYGTITFPFEGKKYIADLEPVDPFQGTRDGAPGIAQKFVWRITGPRARALNPDVNNATHWFGITIPVNFQAYRADTQQVVKPLPGGSVIVWTLKPTSKLIDGSEAKPLTVERKWNVGALSSMDALNDLPPANYSVSAVAKLPDGSTKPVLVEEFNERKYKPVATLILQPSGDAVWTLPTMLSWVVE